MQQRVAPASSVTHRAAEPRGFRPLWSSSLGVAGTPTVGPGTIAAAVMCLGLTLGAAAHAADSSELWPELSLYIGLNDTHRIFLDATNSRSAD